jgi:serine/threonine-protein kinase
VRGIFLGGMIEDPTTADAAGARPPTPLFPGAPDERPRRRARPAPPVAPEPPSPVPVIDRRAALEREELQAATLRLRTSLAVGLALWLLFGVGDWLIVEYIEPGRLDFFWALRLLGVLVMVATLVRLRFGPPTLRRLRLLDGIVYTSVSVLLGVMCVRFGGIASPYSPGVGVILVCHTLSMNEHWKRNVVALGLPALAHPLTLLACALVSDRVAAQLHDSRALALFIINGFMILSTWFFLVIGGHAMWSVRQKLLEMRSIGQYRLRRRLGKGGMGEVWAAWHETLKREVAIKLLRPDILEHEAAIVRFEREVRATAELTHPNTVRIFDYGVTAEGHWYYVMELLEGRDLAALVGEAGPLPPRRALHLVRQAARALAEAHARGIVHRDLKPQNLFAATLGGEGDVVKVLDFGVAKLADPALTGLTGEGHLAGTPAYMAPEVIGGAEATPAADVYALGGVLYFLLTGRAPFTAASVEALLAAQVSAPPVPPSARVDRAIPADLEAVVLRCLEKRPDARYRDAAELSAALAECAVVVLHSP